MNTILVFDLDNTLYPYRSGLYHYINERMNAFLQERFGWDYPTVNQVRTGFIKKYGTTQQGLFLEYGITPETFLSYAHDIDIESYLSPSDDLIHFFQESPYPTYLFTNSPKWYAIRILKHLQIDSFFSDYITIETLDYIGKPNHSAYEVLLERISLSSSIVFVDDEKKNIETGKSFGFIGILVEGRNYLPKDFYGQYLIPLLKEKI